MNTKLPKQELTRDSIRNTLPPANQKIFDKLITDKVFKDLMTPI
jgi:hypothetical protein